VNPACLFRCAKIQNSDQEKAEEPHEDIAGSSAFVMMDFLDSLI
jgi:hypothetical protein